MKFNLFNKSIEIDPFTSMPELEKQFLKYGFKDSSIVEYRGGFMGYTIYSNFEFRNPENENQKFVCIGNYKGTKSLEMYIIYHGLKYGGVKRIYIWKRKFWNPVHKISQLTIEEKY